MFQMIEQDKTSEKDLNETEISNLPNKEFKVMAIKTLKKLERRIDEHSKNFNKEIEDIRRHDTELKNAIAELKKTHQRWLKAN